MEEFNTGPDLTLIAKYLNNEADEAEISRVNQWIAASDANRTEFDKIQKAWNLATAAIGLPEWDATGSKESFLLKIIEAQSKVIAIAGKTGENKTEGQTPFITRSSSRPGIFRTQILLQFIKYAAIAIILLAIPAILLIRSNRGVFDETFKGQLVTQVSASRGSKTQMTLADGSKIWLNAGSTIKYGSDYNKHSRELLLVGEAYFEVAKDAKRPFNVHAGNVIVHAIGTIFNVKAYPEESVVETTLVEGSVSVELKNGAAHEMILMPKEQVYYYKPDIPEKKSEKVLISKGIEPEQYTSWINDELVINNETLESLTVKLGRKYDVIFQFEEDSLKELRFTGVLRNETIEQILDILKISASVNYRIDKREIFFLKN
jgi:ferric-dicitrate binding protein FerR (iron transport regulator)